MDSTAELEDMVTDLVRRNSVAGAIPFIPRDGNLFLMGILDSLSVVTVVAELETPLGGPIPEDELVPENFRSVECIAALCAKLRPAQAGEGT